MKNQPLKQILDYLLTVQLTVSVNPETGEPSNQRLRTLFMDLVGKIAPAVFFDIGARDGESALAVKQLLPECRAYAFEANPNIYAQFSATHEADDHVAYRNLAISNRCGVIDLYVPRVSSEVVIDDEIVAMEHIEASDTGRSSLLKRTDLGATYETLSVNAVTLDRFCRDEKITSLRPTALWIDVEGAANLVLAGAKRALKRAALIFIEVEGHAFWDAQARAHTVISQLMQLGFVPIARDREYHDKQFNVLLLRPEFLHVGIPHLYDTKSKFSQAKATGEQITALQAECRLSKVATTGKNAKAHSSTNFVPILIPTFNNPTFLRNMIEQLHALNCTNIMVMDNASTFPPMLEYLEQLAGQVEVVMFEDNKGPKRVWTDGEFYKRLPKIFCVTDPDLQFNKEMPLDFTDQLYAISERYKCGKVGLALDISNVPSLRQDDYQINERVYKIWEWESQFWQKEIEPNIYEAYVDTTFALYNKSYFEPLVDALTAFRVGGTLTCQHLPWLKAFSLPHEELAVYRRTNLYSYYFPSSERGAPTG